MNKVITELATKYINSLSFEFDNFNQSRCVLTEGEYTIEYDRFSLRIFSHNLNASAYRYFSKVAYRLCIDTISNEQQKRMHEFNALLAFSNIFQEFLSAKILVATHPDFVINCNDRLYGIEVTELTVPEDKILNKIVLDTYNENLSIEESKRMATQKHGPLSKKFSYDEINGKTSIVSPLILMNSRRISFKNQILKKYQKYKDRIENYDEFIILCDARRGIDITEDYEIEEIFDSVDSGEHIKNVTVIILYTDDIGKLKHKVKRWL